MVKKSKTVVPKKARGRPATGRDPVTAIRLSETLRTTVDDWATRQSDKPGRSEAIRRLVEIGLEKSAPAKKSSEKQRDRAAELAEKQIDKLVGDAPDAAVRKRRLINGPSTVRDVRVDRKPK